MYTCKSTNIHPISYSMVIMSSFPSFLKCIMNHFTRLSLSGFHLLNKVLNMMKLT